MVRISIEELKSVQAILKKEVPEIPVEKIILNSTHTHSGPSYVNSKADYLKEVGVMPPSKFLAFLTRQVADAVKEAWASRAPGSIAYGYGFATSGHSRRSVYRKDIGKLRPAAAGITVNGHVVMYGKTDDELFDGFEAGTNAFINLLYTFDKKDRLTGAVINVPCPAQTNEHAWMLHAGFWHHVREKLEAKYGRIGVIGQAAAAGDLSPRQLLYLAA